MYTDPKTYPFAILYFTGSGSFNIEMRKIAANKGYRLNEHHIVEAPKYTGLKGKEIDAVFKSEKDIFDFLNIPYIEPKERTRENLLKRYKS